jgi:hypothetical protein
MRLKEFQYFAETFFKIRTKNGSVIPFELNRAQLYIHDRLEAQLKETGKVRAICLKGRQQGVSTLIQARYFHKTVTNRGMKTFILTHETAATKNLFDMTRRYYEYLPAGLIPKANRDSQKELKFESIDSGYAIGTAGAKGTGRSQTVQLLHGCLGAGTRIYDPTTGGLKLIEDFIVGDRVQTHTGAIANISYISSQKKECLSVVFRGLTAFPLIATPEHRFWTKQGWKELRHLNIGDSIGYPVGTIHNVLTTELLPKATVRAHGGGRQFLCPDEINCNYEFGRLLGLYLADGHIALQYKSPHYPSRLEFAVHRKEVNRTIEWLLPFSSYYSSMKVNHREDSLTSIITIYGNRFIRLINRMCGRTKEKKFPFDWSLKGREFCLGLLHGYLAGDGSSYAEDRRIRATSICSSLTITLRDICASLGFGWAGIEHKKSAVRHGRNEKEAYIFSLCGEGVNDIARSLGKPAPPILRIKTKSTKNNAANTTEISEGYAWVRIKEMEDVGEKVVYDFEVNHDDHSYCTIHGATHNSECAFWPNAAEHAQGLMQAVGDQDGTEIILESTANGIGNYFHSVWVAAEQGKSDFQAIFVPWYWQPEYRAFHNQSHDEISLTEEEQRLMDAYGSDGMTREHIYWRRFKIGQFSNDHDVGVRLFQQEYPCCASESFLNPIDDTFIPSVHVSKARKVKIDIARTTPLYIGVDPAIGDNDRCAIIKRKGRVAYDLEFLRNHNTMELAGRLKTMIDKEKPAKVFIDCIGIGAGVVDRLQEMGYECVVGINVARTANNKERFGNLRAELWSEMRDWLMGEIPVQIPDSDELHTDLCGLGYKHRSNGQLLIESKDDLRKRGMPSPDAADALSMTFAFGMYAGESNFAPNFMPDQHRGMFT